MVNFRFLWYCWEDQEDEVGMQRQGREKEAIYNQVLKNKNIDFGLTTTASNNLIPVNKDQNIFESKKRIKSATVKGLEAKLNFAQRFF